MNENGSIFDIFRFRITSDDYIQSRWPRSKKKYTDYFLLQSHQLQIGRRVIEHSL